METALSDVYYELVAPANLGVVPSNPIIISPPFVSTQSQTGPPTLSALLSSAPGLVPSQQPESSPTLTSPESVITDSVVLPPATPNPGYSPPLPITTKITSEASTVPGNVTGTSSMQSTAEGLKPIPPAETQVGDPNGHHEITEPNFTSTKPCRGCSPVIEITASGWGDPAEQHGSTMEPSRSAMGGLVGATLRSNILISPGSGGGDYVIGGSMTVMPGQTVTMEDLPIVVQTSEGHVEVIVGTTVIQLQPDISSTGYTNKAQVTDAPVLLPPILTLGTKTVTPNEQTQYNIADQTLIPGGSAITISGTTLSLAPFATVLIINGETSSLTPILGEIYTTVAPAILEFNNHVYTANRAGYIILGPGTTLIPGGSAITVDGTTLSLEHSGTAVVVQGSTSALQPVTTVVTLTRSVAAGSGALSTGRSTTLEYLYPTENPVLASASKLGDAIADRWLGGIILLVWCGAGFFAIWL